METLQHVVVVTHLLGMAAIIGGFIANRSEPTPGLVWGARAQLITGVVLVGLAQALKDEDGPVNNTKIAVKLVIALLVAGAAEMANGRYGQGEKVEKWVTSAGVLAIVNVCVAVLWI